MIPQPPSRRTVDSAEDVEEIRRQCGPDDEVHAGERVNESAFLGVQAVSPRK